MDTGGAVAAVTNPIDLDGADGLQGRAEVAGAALLHMRLQQQSLDLAAFALLPLFDQMQIHAHKTAASRSAPSDAYAKRFRELKTELAQIEFFSQGAVLRRMVKCGKPQCACRSKPSIRHGPYYEWTYKARGKIINVRLSAETAPIFQSAAKQYRKLKSILNRLQESVASGARQVGPGRRPSPSPLSKTPGISSYPRF